MEERKNKIEIGYHLGKLTVAADTGKRKNGYTVWLCKCDCGGSIELDTRAIQRGTYRDCGCETKVAPGVRDLTEMRFGKLVAISPTADRKYGTTVWQCVCDCGNTACVPAKQLLSGYVKSCGCLGHPPLKDLAGKRFGKLTVLSYVGKREGQHYWRCRCDCGNETEVRQNYLQRGRTTSCGCLAHPPLEDLVGKRFGKLTVLAYEEKRDGQHYWRCKCDCGNEAVVRQNYLQRGHTTSCGCVRAGMYRDNLKLVDGTSVTILEAGKKRLISSNTSGYTGVYLHRKTGKWMAQITFRNKTYFLGAYNKKEDAVKARQKGEEMHDEFLEWYHSTREKKTEKDTL